jgi:hypothetical protein
MKVGGTASITAITQIITMVLMGFFGTMDGLETNGQHLLGVILSISSTTIILKTFEELGKKLKICGNSDWFPHCSGYCSHINDGSTIYRGSKSTIFRNRVSVRAETDFLPNNLVCQRDIFHTYSKKPNIY